MDDQDHESCSSDDSVECEQEEFEEEEEDDDDDDDDNNNNNLDESSVSPEVDGDGEELLDIVVKRVGKGDGDALSLRLNPSKTVFDLKCQIQELTEKKDKDLIPVDRQRLVYFGRMLRDNEELLGRDGIKMKPEVTNYIHLSPLPEGATPSPRNAASNRSGSNFAASVSFSPSFAFASASHSALAATGSSRDAHQRALERARRFGAASRERRRRRQDRPYNSADSTRDAAEASHSDSSPARTEDFNRDRRSSERNAAAAVDAIRVEPPSASGETGRHALSLQAGIFSYPPFSSAVLAPSSIFASSVGSPPTTSATRGTGSSSRASPLVSLAASIGASSSGGQAASMQRAQALALDLVPILPILEERLRQISVGSLGVGGTLFGGNASGAQTDLEDTIGLLNQISRDASALAMHLRRLPPESLSPVAAGAVTPALGSSAMSVARAPLAAVAAPIALEQLISASDPTILIPGSPPIFFPATSGSWFPSMM